MTPPTLFQRIISREIPADIVFEDDLCIAFRDINPVAPVHILIVPKKLIPMLDDATEEDQATLGHLFLVASRLAEDNGIKGAYRTVFNCGTDAGQSVFHLHLHLLGGRTFSWPPG